MSAHISQMIKAKNSTVPFWGTVGDLALTDMDHFPYTRFYRGEINSSEPVVIDREAGWHPRRNCYANPKGYSTVPCDRTGHRKNICFQGGCTATLPCYEAPHKHNALALSNDCVLQYR